jgi:glucose/arabinose dehydrogenase
MLRGCLFLAVLLFSYSSALAVSTVNDPSLIVTQLVAGLNAPTTMAFIGPSDILVLQKGDGKVRRVLSGILQAGSMLDVNVNDDSERGLLGIALHPNFSTNGFVYLYFTESNSGADGGSPAGNRVYRYTWDGNALSSPQLIIDLPVTPGPNHDGGIILFGPDGKLYIVIGDLNRNGQLQNNTAPGADPPDDTSVILRLNDDGSTPGDNPFSGSAGFERYFAYGIRNSFGMAFDPETNKLWITHNGPSNFDEIDLVDAGFNSGWNLIMGPDDSDPQNEADLLQIPNSHYADPKFSWRNTVGPTGIAFLDSAALGAQHENQAFVGDVNNGNLYRFPLNGARDGFVLSGALADLVADNSSELNQVIFGTGFGGITDLKVGSDGFLYVVSIGDGAIYVIKPATAAPTFAVSLLPNGEVGLAYDVDLNIGGGTPPYDVTVIKGKLPAGLDPVGVDISGTPTVAGTSSFTLQVTDANQASATKKFRIKVIKAVNIMTNRLKRGKVSKPYNATLRANRGKKPFTWSHLGTLPVWLLLNPTTGRLTGTPPVDDPVIFTVVVTDDLGATESKDLTLVVNN